MWFLEIREGHHLYLRTSPVIGHSMDYDALYDLVHQRRSIRSYSDKSVSDQDIEKILDVARRAPSAANSQPWEFVVVKDEATREEIMETYRQEDLERRELEETRSPEYRFWGPDSSVDDSVSFRISYADAPVQIVVLGDERTTATYPWRSENTLHHRLWNFYASLANATLLIQLAAFSLGLGAKYNTTAQDPRLESTIKRVLDVPSELSVYEMITVGHFDYDPSPSWRRDLDDQVHWGSYDRSKFRDDEEMDEFVRSKPRTGRD